MKGEHKSKARLALKHAAASAMVFALTGPVGATELVYHPYNPSFGGSPLNGQVLLNSALATNKHKAPDIDSDRYGIEEKSALERLNETIERTVISRLAMSAGSRLLDGDGNFIPGGALETDNFIIRVSDPNDGGFLTITTIDKATGGVTTFEVMQR